MGNCSIDLYCHGDRVIDSLTSGAGLLLSIAQGEVDIQLIWLLPQRLLPWCWHRETVAMVLTRIVATVPAEARS